jgi:subtilisin family serine protease
MAACTLAPGPALAMVGPKSDGPLSPGLAELAKPSVRSKSNTKQAAILGVVGSGPGSLLREGNRVFVNIRFESGAIARLNALKAAGAQVVSASRRYQTVTVAATPAALREVAGVPGVASVTESLAPIVYGSAMTSVTSEGSCEGGSVISEGVSQLHGGEAREHFGLRGRGVTVGVLSDSFNTATQEADGPGPIATHAHQDIKSNDLPGLAGTCSGQQAPVNVLEDDAPIEEGETADEGRAMLQIVHDVAPHASLAFATAFKFNSEQLFAQNIERLARPVAEGGAGAKVIADDVAYFEEPFFQDGPVADAINKVTGEGVTYLTAAGNDNLFEGKNEIASWEAPEYRDAGACPSAVQTFLKAPETHCMDFNPGAPIDDTFGITVEAHATLTVDLQWAEPWNGVGADLDAFLLSGGKVVSTAVKDNITTQRPVEVLQWENTASESREVQLAINRCFATCNPEASSTAKPRLKFALLENGRGVTKTEYPKSKEGDVVGPTIFGHAGAKSAITVGAVPYDNSSEPEEYSSRGPVTHYFAPVEGTTAAAALGSPETIAKPNVVATDCGATTFFAQLSGPTWRFCGTSAAAPHAAGVAALMLQGDPTATPEQIRTGLTESATKLPGFPENAVGSGLIEAVGALEDIGATATKEDGPSTVVPPLETESEPTTGITTTPTSTPPPTTSFKKHPPKVVRTRRRTVRVVFRFGSDQTAVTFLCKVDHGRFHPCGARLSRWFPLGGHTVRVKAQDAAGNVDSTPAVFRFRVKRVG